MESDTLKVVCGIEQTNFKKLCKILDYIKAGKFYKQWKTTRKIFDNFDDYDLIKVKEFIQRYYIFKMGEVSSFDRNAVKMIELIEKEIKERVFVDCI